MSDPFVAEIRVFPFNFAPKGWALCDGQLLSISQNTALFSLLGTFYGGDGKSNFALPNLQGCVPLHQGQGPGLSDRFLGETGGNPSVTLLQSEMPGHSHALTGDENDGSFKTPSNMYMGGGSAMYTNTGPNVTLAPQALALDGQSQPHNNMQPFLTLSFCIALQGIFPPRS